MKTITAAALAASVALLAACAQSGQKGHDHKGHGHKGHHHGHAHHKGADMSGASKFECDNGLTVYVQNLDNDQVKLRVDGREAVMTQAPSGSGERYVADTGLWSKGGEWHQKGSQAHFSYTGVHGNQGSTACYHGK